MEIVKKLREILTINWPSTINSFKHCKSNIRNLKNKLKANQKERTNGKLALSCLFCSIC